MAIFPFRFDKKPKKEKITLAASLPPKIRTKAFPGPQSAKLTESLKRYECPQITYVGGVFPVLLQKGQAANLYDVDGNRYLDLTSAFGVSGIGHASPSVVRALTQESKQLIHGMGDVHPTETKVLLAKKLSEITPGNLNQTIFSSTGFEAVESALKTAVMHTKKTGVIAFTGAYHGLGYGALNVTHREDFRKPFMKQLGGFSYFAPFPDSRAHGSKSTEITMKAVRQIFKKARRSKHPVGAVLVEPIQGRGGIQVPPADFLKALRTFCDEEKILLILDEVFTGFGRTGSMFASEKSGVIPDLLCVGKMMGGGMPISACIGTARVMYSWGTSTGEAIHTSTFLGHPLGCAAALAVIGEIESKKLVERSKTMGDLFRKELWKLKEKHALISDVRGAGLMIGMELGRLETSGKKGPVLVPATEKARIFVQEAMRTGFLVLPSGPHHEVISITPPLIISEKDIAWTIAAFDKILKKLEEGSVF